MTAYRFPYHHQIRPESDPLLRFKNEPLLDIALQNKKTGKLVKIISYIDTGSQWCLFDKQYAYQLGIKNYNAGQGHDIGGIGGPNANVAYFHDLTLIVFTDAKKLEIDKAVKVNIKVGFLEKDCGFGGILGVYGFLDRFTFFSNIPNRYFEIEDVL